MHVHTSPTTASEPKLILQVRRWQAWPQHTGRVLIFIFDSTLCVLLLRSCVFSLSFSSLVHFLLQNNKLIMCFLKTGSSAYNNCIIVRSFSRCCCRCFFFLLHTAELLSLCRRWRRGRCCLLVFRIHSGPTRILISFLSYFSSFCNVSISFWSLKCFLVRIFFLSVSFPLLVAVAHRRSSSFFLFFFYFHEFHSIDWLTDWLLPCAFWCTFTFHWVCCCSVHAARAHRAHSSIRLVYVARERH